MLTLFRRRKTPKASKPLVSVVLTGRREVYVTEEINTPTWKVPGLLWNIKSNKHSIWVLKCNQQQNVMIIAIITIRIKHILIIIKFQNFTYTYEIGIQDQYPLLLWYYLYILMATVATIFTRNSHKKFKNKNANTLKQKVFCLCCKSSLFVICIW